MKKLLTIASIFCLMFIHHTSAVAEFYKWVDEHGRVHYGDKPASSNKAKRVNTRDNRLATPNKNTRTMKPTTARPSTPSVNDIRSGRAQMHADIKARMNQKIQQSQSDYSKKMEQDNKRTKERIKIGERLADKQRERDAAKLRVNLDAAQRRNGTQVLCQRQPQHPKCGWMRNTSPLTQHSQEDKDRINEINKKFNAEVKREFKKYPR